MTRRERIVSAIKIELEKILVANGYKTDIGLNVVIEQEKISDGLMSLVNIFEGNDSLIDDQTGSVFINLPIDLEVFLVVADANNRNKEKNKIISDIKKCIAEYRYKKSIEMSEISYPTSNQVEKENGSNFLIVGMSFNVEYHERSGDPDY